MPLMGFSSKLNAAEEKKKISELENISIVILKIKKKIEQRLEKKTQVSKKCGKITHSITYA